MKTKLILLMLFAYMITKADKDVDSLRRVTFNKIMHSYLSRLTEITAKIEQSNDQDSIRCYAKRVMKLSDEMERKIKNYYHYSSSQIIPIYSVASNGKTSTTIISYIFTNPSPTPPFVCSVNRIYDLASHIRFFCYKKPERIKKKLTEIRELRQDMFSV